MKWVALFGIIAAVLGGVLAMDIVPPSLASPANTVCWIATAGFVITLLSYLIRGK